MPHNHHPKKVAGDMFATMVVGSVLFFAIVPTLLFGLAHVIQAFGDGMRAVLGN